MATTVTRMPYCMCYVRHIDGIEYHLNDVLAPRYVDVIEHNNIRTIDRAKNRRLQELKVISYVNSLHTIDCAVGTTDRFLSSASPFMCVESNSGVADPGAAAARPGTRVVEWLCAELATSK